MTETTPVIEKPYHESVIALLSRSVARLMEVAERMSKGNEPLVLSYLSEADAPCLILLELIRGTKVPEKHQSALLSSLRELAGSLLDPNDVFYGEEVLPYLGTVQQQLLSVIEALTPTPDDSQQAPAETETESGEPKKSSLHKVALELLSTTISTLKLLNETARGFSACADNLMAPIDMLIGKVLEIVEDIPPELMQGVLLQLEELRDLAIDEGHKQKLAAAIVDLSCTGTEPTTDDQSPTD